MEEIRGRRAMLSFPQMATKAQITAEQYLHMTFEYDVEFVRGEIIKRGMPDRLHSKIQLRILLLIGRLLQSHPLFPYPGLRLRLEPLVYRVPDVSVFAGQDPKQSVPSSPPLLVIEILSRDDRHQDLMVKLEDYGVWGVPNIWVVDPHAKCFSICTERRLQNVSSLALADYPLELTQDTLFTDL
jgi:Uma2 family endonuclease